MATSAFPQDLMVRIRGNSAEIEAAGKRAVGALNGVQGTAAKVTQQSSAAGAGLKRMEGPLRTIASQAMGTNAALLNVATILGGFALSGGVMAAALVGLAALGLAWERITKTSREAKEEQAKLLEQLKKMREEAELGVAGPGLLLYEAAQARVGRMESRLEGMHPLARAGKPGENLRAQIVIAKRDLELATAALQETLGKVGVAIGDEILDMGRVIRERAAIAANVIAGIATANALRMDQGRFDHANKIQAWRASKILNRGISGIGSNQLGGPDLLPFGMRIESMSGTGQAADMRLAKNRGLLPAADEFNHAAGVTIAAFGAMASAAISGSEQMEQALIGGITNILQSMHFAQAGPWGAIIGAIGGIAGALFGRRGRSDPLPVRIQEIEPRVANEMRGPDTVILQMVSPTGDIRETEYQLRRRTSRDAVQRVPTGVRLE